MENKKKSKVEEYVSQLQGRGSNYEIAKYQAQELFLRFDQEQLIEKMELEYDQHFLYIRFVGRMYRICRTTGKVEWTEDAFVSSFEAGFNEVLTIFDVLCYSKKDAQASGVLVNMKSLSGIHGSSSSSIGGGFFYKIGKQFDHKDELLSKACERLGGKKMQKGDVSYQIALFDFLPVMIQFWDSDEEFDASLEIFTDKNILLFMRYETVWYAVSHLLERIIEGLK